MAEYIPGPPKNQRVTRVEALVVGPRYRKIGESFFIPKTFIDKLWDDTRFWNDQNVWDQ